MAGAPEALRWAAYLTGTELPEADPAGLRRQGEIWGDLGRKVQSMVSEVNAANAQVQGHITGDPAEAFTDYMRQLNSTLPGLAQAAENMQIMHDDFALQVEHATNLVIAMLSWMLVELAFLANSLFGLAAVPALITGVRAVIMAILRRLLLSTAVGAGMMTGLETLLQAIEILEGHRKKLDPKAITDMAVGGAIGGAAFGALSGLGRVVAPRASNSLIGRTLIGGTAGVVGGAAANAAIGGEMDLGLAFLGGAAGAALGMPGTGGGTRGKDPGSAVPDVANLVKAPDDSTFTGPGGPKGQSAVDPLTVATSGAPGPGTTGAGAGGTTGAPRSGAGADAAAPGPAPVRATTGGSTGAPDGAARTSTGAGAGAEADAIFGTGGRTGTEAGSDADADAAFGTGSGTGGRTGTASGTAESAGRRTPFVTAAGDGIPVGTSGTRPGVVTAGGSGAGTARPAGDGLPGFDEAPRASAGPENATVAGGRGPRRGPPTVRSPPRWSGARRPGPPRSGRRSPDPP